MITATPATTNNRIERSVAGIDSPYVGLGTHTLTEVADLPE